MSRYWSSLAIANKSPVTPIPFACLTSSSMHATLTWMGLIHGSIHLGTLFAGTALEFHPVSAMWFMVGGLQISKTLHAPKP
ncbi:uncharacterized protein A1O9_05387 [Exophiala aquamarina CBS 119918]|uniref:Uncharacterized protein n=1 Tax=Exophiala aquamarina CBS 119918 TaxID=1182545 RepID=A0A072PPM4_9EURO|nr:uncharacterized protein A1O9_05387 [Exophiala aquamarina CBS 119918]KEF57470.1 hypothetical protein A1O9_05387 [Exophiala aquamarina CBS 119918]